MLQLEEIQSQLADCLSRCVNAYNSATLMLQRYTTFDELTARLGDGFVASPAYADIPWKRDGVVGIRPKIVDLLCDLFSLADERLGEC